MIFSKAKVEVLAFAKVRIGICISYCQSVTYQASKDLVVYSRTSNLPADLAIPQNIKKNMG